MNRSLTIANQLGAIVYDNSGRASVPTIEIGPDQLDDITEVELVCGCPRHRRRVPLDARRRLHARR